MFLKLRGEKLYQFSPRFLNFLVDLEFLTIQDLGSFLVMFELSFPHAKI